MSIVGRKVGPIGFGLMGLTWRPNPAPIETSIATLKAALDNGLTMWNGADFYGTPQYNTMTLVKAYFTKYPEDADKVTLAIKGGLDLATFKPDGSAANTRRSMDNILAQLGGVKKVDVFVIARRDANTPLKETFDVLQSEYIATGKLGGVGISECGPATIHEAAAAGKVACAEVELSLFTTDILHNGVAAACAQHDIPIVAYSPMGRGMLTGRFKGAAPTAAEFGIVANFPRFSPENFEHNSKFVAQVEAIAEKKQCTSAQLALAWVHALGKADNLPTIFPIPGATTIPRVEENSKLIALSDDEMKQLNDMAAAFETAGTRYPAGAPTNT